jgi:hypothetical protein
MRSVLSRAARGVRHWLSHWSRRKILILGFASLVLLFVAFHIARRNRSTSHLAGFGSTMTGGTRSTRLVPTVTLDSLAAQFPAPDVIKIDVEGAELPVLAGGTVVLSRMPTVICEVSGQNAEGATEILTGHGYTLYDGDQRPGERVAVSVAPFNTLAVAASGAGLANTSAPKPGSSTSTRHPLASGR